MAADHRLDERGSATIWALGWTAVIVTISYAAMLMASVIATKHQIEAAADLAALSGAAQIQRGEDGCLVARQIVIRDAANLASCQVDGSDIIVTAVRDIELPFGISRRLQAAARAGP